jgi:hypothetical protein
MCLGSFAASSQELLRVYVINISHPLADEGLICEMFYRHLIFLYYNPIKHSPKIMLLVRVRNAQCQR